MTIQGRVARMQRITARHSENDTGDRAVRARLTIILLAAALCFAALFSLTAGASDASVLSVLRTLTSAGTEGADAFRRDHLIIMEIRLPRIVMGMLIGAGLAVSMM
ncbi:MAG: iron ABC transporter, partial [Brucella intermedia]